MLTKPFKENKKILANKYQEIFAHLPNFTLLSPSYDSAFLAAKIIAQNNFTLIDSFQLALATESDGKSFMANDRKLKRSADLKIFLISDF